MDRSHVDINSVVRGMVALAKNCEPFAGVSLEARYGALPLNVGMRAARAVVRAERARAAGWNITQAASNAGMQRTNFHALMRRHGIRRV